MEKKMIPYSVYLPEAYHAKLKALAKRRQASALVRDAISMIVDGGDAYRTGYNSGIKDASKVVYDCEEAQMVAVKGRDIGAVLADRINKLKK
jgi:hypothetical protein